MEGKYYLLTFNEDYADEHDVPGLACFTEEEYQKWLETPSGKLNENYDNEMKIYQSKIDEYNNFQTELTNRNLRNKKFNEFTKEENEWYNENKKDYISQWRDKPIRVESNLRAHLGNSGDHFEESFNNLYLMKEFIENNYVKVTEVDKSFFNYFNTAGLAGLSLTNIFEIDEY